MSALELLQGSARGFLIMSGNATKTVLNKLKSFLASSPPVWSES